MSTRPSDEVRHRWTPAERARLIEASKPFTTLTEATDALYVGLGMPRRAVHAQLYELYLKGRVPHLELERQRNNGLELSSGALRAIRDLARAMRADGISDVLITVGNTVRVEASRRSGPLEIEFE